LLNIEQLGGDTQDVAIKAIVLGPHGIGKTSLIRDLPEASPLLIDLEAGALALGPRTQNGETLPAWRGLRVDVFKEAQRLKLSVWQVATSIAVWLGGPSPFVSRDGESYSQMHYDYAVSIFGNPAPVLDRVSTVFVDSISVASRSCLQWSKGQPRAQVEKGDKKGQLDTRGMYGLVKDETLAWLTQLQHTPKNIIMVGGLDPVEDDNGRKSWRPQIEGSGAANALPGIVDLIVTYTELQPPPPDGGEKYRAFVCQTLNPWGFPAKDRSGALDLQEEPNLAKLMAKINPVR